MLEVDKSRRAALLIFVDAVKELPATLILRPFNFETLATTVYGAASLEQLDQAGPAALAIVVVGLALVVAACSAIGTPVTFISWNGPMPTRKAFLAAASMVGMSAVPSSSCDCIESL